MLIVYPRLGGGWSPITYMVTLAAELLEADLLLLTREQVRAGTLRKLLTVLPRRRGDENCLLVCGEPQHLQAIVHATSWRSRFRQLAAWVIDGFWVEQIPKIARHTSTFDRFFVTTEEDVQAWERATGTPTTALPWGSDVLRLGSGSGERPVDLVRIGRQPPAWDDDAGTGKACAHLGLRFVGRPGMLPDQIENHRHVMRTYAQSKFVLAFSNGVDGSRYTHPTREYLTGRWTDALAAGAVVAGVPPRSADADLGLWPGATLDLGTTRRGVGLGALAEAARAWRPRDAARNHALALERLDWRWRFAALARAFDEPAPRLRAELTELRRRVGAGLLRAGSTM